MWIINYVPTESCVIEFETWRFNLCFGGVWVWDSCLERVWLLSSVPWHWTHYDPVICLKMDTCHDHSRSSALEALDRSYAFLKRLICHTWKMFEGFNELWMRNECKSISFLFMFFYFYFFYLCQWMVWWQSTQNHMANAITWNNLIGKLKV